MSYESTVLATSGLQYYWILGETTGTSAADSQGSNTGTYTGTGWTLNQAGLPGSTHGMAESSGAGGTYIATTDGPLNSFGVSTLECWVYISALPPPDQSVPITFGNGGDQMTVFDKTLCIQHDGQLKFHVYSGGLADLIGGSISTGAFHHLVGVADGVNGYVYIDGTQVFTQSLGSTYGGFSGGGTILIAGETVGTIGTSNYFTGKIGHVAVYNVGLDSTTVAAHYSAGITAPGGSTLFRPATSNRRRGSRGVHPSVV